MVPGNADRREAMRAGFPDAPWRKDGPLHVAETIAGVRLIGLDVTVPGEKHGEVTPEVHRVPGPAPSTRQLRRLMVFMHQHPFPAANGGDLDAPDVPQRRTAA